MCLPNIGYPCAFGYKDNENLKVSQRNVNIFPPIQELISICNCKASIVVEKHVQIKRLKFLFALFPFVNVEVIIARFHTFKSKKFQSFDMNMFFNHKFCNCNLASAWVSVPGWIEIYSSSFEELVDSHRFCIQIHKDLAYTLYGNTNNIKRVITNISKIVVLMERALD